MVNMLVHTDNLISPIQSLQDYFRDGGVSIVQAAFAHTYFVDPNVVRKRTPYFRDRVRYSRSHYPGLGKGTQTVWPPDGREIRLDDNQYAQNAWVQYTGRKIERRSGYGLRHIWGNTHDPEAFTAGWNFCYMPFWAGMLTEEQHPHQQLRQAIRQASWDLYFRHDPVCSPPEYVEDPGHDLETILTGQPLLILARENPANSKINSATVKQGPVLPIILDPSPARVFKRELLRTRQAWIVVTYVNGSEEIHPWKAEQITSSSNIIGNLRSRPAFRAGAWQQNGIATVRVSIEKP